jgi:pimeloyl-ACP methyl ester carboxylesterase
VQLFLEVQWKTAFDLSQEKMLMSERDRMFNGPEGDFYYIDWGGTGPAAHFSHATGLCAGVYSPLMRLLKPHLSIIGMDDRGHGKTSVPADPAKLKNWDVFVKDLAIFFESLAEPVIAMGHSRGATVSLLLAIKRPELIRALVLVDPTILPFSWMWWWYLAKKTGVAKRVPIVATAAKRKYVWPDRRSILESYREKTVFSSWQDGFLEAYIEAGTTVTADSKIKLCCKPAWESRCFAVCPHDVWRYIPRLKQPTLVLYGAESDTFLAPAAKRFKAKVPSAVMVPLAETGHFVPMERPAETAETIIDFLKKEAIV